MCANPSGIGAERPVIDMAATGRKIMHLRRAAGLSVRALQEVFGFSSPQAIYKWQRGEALPTLDNFVLLARTLGVRVEDVLVFVPEKEQQEGGRRDHG